MPNPSRPSTPPTLRAAVDASVGWYEDICALHGTATLLRDGVWSAVGPPPPLHSGVVVVEPGVTADQVLDRMSATADLAAALAAGFEVTGELRVWVP